jgi:GDP-L-fucose synthase
MNILITGGKGFIAKSLTEQLSKNAKYQIFSPSSKELNLINESDVDNFILSNKIDIIIHTANKGGGRDTLDFKNLTEYNLRMFFNIAKHEKNVKKIISFGSGAEYGKHKPIIDVKEDEYKKSQPLDEYGFYKSITSKYIEKSEKIIQLRIFACYGKYENYLLKFITNSIVKNLFKLPIIINQNVYFDYMYIDDLINIVDYFINNEAKYKIYNASSGKKIDLLTLANTINKISDYTSEIVVLNSDLNNEYSSNNDRLKGEITKLNFISHEEAISEMYKYFKSNLSFIDKQEIIDDKYLENCNKIWRK